MREESKRSQKRYIIKQARIMGDWSFILLKNPEASVEHVSEIFLPKGQEIGDLLTPLRPWPRAAPRRHCSLYFLPVPGSSQNEPSCRDADTESWK